MRSIENNVSRLSLTELGLGCAAGSSKSAAAGELVEGCVHNSTTLATQSLSPTLTHNGVLPWLNWRIVLSDDMASLHISLALHNVFDHSAPYATKQTFQRTT